MAPLACTEGEVTKKSTPKKDAGKGGNNDDDGETTPSPEGTENNPPPQADPPLPDGGTAPGAVYGHTADTLYILEPIDRTLNPVGKFSCLDVDDMLDIALDKNGAMFGTSRDGFVSINSDDAKCQFIKKGATRNAYPNSLSFVPAGTVDPMTEALVGYQYADTAAVGGTVYVRIDTATGAVSKIGNLNPPGATTTWAASGDLVALIRNGNKAYLTVKQVTPVPEAGVDQTDRLAEVDPATGMIKTVIGNIGKSNLYGFGFWAGTGFGFNDEGYVLEIDMTKGTSTVLMRLVDENNTPLAWYGAGVKTFAPTAPTK